MATDGSTTEERQPRSAERWRDAAVKIWAVIGGLILIAVAGWLLRLLSFALTPFVIAFVIAYILRAPVRRLAAAGVPRPLAIISCYLVGTVLLALIGQVLLPPMFDQVRGFLENLPEYSSEAADFYTGVLAQLRGLPKMVTDLSGTVAGELAGALENIAQATGSGIVALGGGLLEFALAFFLGLVVAFWVLKDSAGLKRDLLALVGPRYREDALHLARNVDHVLSGYLLGQTVNTVTIGILLTIWLAILGVPYPLVLGALAGVLNLVPYVGPFIGAALTVIVALFISPFIAVLALVGYLVVQQIQDSIISPLIMSEGVNLHPILIIFAIAVGGSLFGFTGLLFAIPVAAFAKGAFVYYFEKHSDRALVSEEGTLFRTQPSEGRRWSPAALLDRIRASRGKGGKGGKGSRG